MKLERYARLKQLFVEALDLEPERRFQFIDDVAHDDDALATDLRNLLDADQSAPEVADVLSTMPERIGDYAVKAVLGIGGMGIVYRAEQARPRRMVALKVMRGEIATPGLLHRFEAEAELLGRLRHPGIAQVHEAGTWFHDGMSTPFFAMEYVEGDSIVRHANEKKLSLDERMRLLGDICRVVEAAHRMGVIHRDLKPENILVDGEGRVRILDFGVARAVGEDPIVTMQTEPGMLIGTLPYMSPEQIGAGSGQVDTRSDVYALGAIGFELLTGRLPRDLEGRSLPDAVLAIRDSEAMTLSLVDPSLRGDIETIIAKALRTNADDRYQAAAALADDIDHYLAREPIEARRATALYSLRQFARRNRTLVGVTATAAVLLLATSVVATVMAVEARWQTGVAEDRARSHFTASEFLRVIMGSIEVEGAIAGRRDAVPDVRIAQVMINGAEQLAEDYEGDPEVEADLRLLFARGFGAVGLSQDALEQRRSALELRLGALGEADRDTIQARILCAGSESRAGNVEECLRLSREALLLARSHHRGDAELLVQALNGLATRLFHDGAHDECTPLMREAVDVARVELAPEHHDRLAAINNQAYLQLRAMDQPAEAEALFLEVLETRRASLGEQLETLRAKDNLATVLRPLKRSGEAIELEREVLAGYIAIYGDKTGPVDFVRGKLATLVWDAGNRAEAIALAERSASWRRENLGPDHRDTADAQQRLLTMLFFAGHHERAEPLARTVLARREAQLGRTDERTVRARMTLARILWNLGDYSSAEPLYAEATPQLGALVGVEHGRSVSARIEHANCLTELGRFDGAEQLLLATEALDANWSGRLRTRLANAFIQLYEAWERPHQAEIWRTR